MAEEEYQEPEPEMSEESAEDRLENDEISAAEEGFEMGYEEAGDEEKQVEEDEEGI